MESRLNHDSDRVELLEKQLKEARDLAAESDRKFEEAFSLIFLFSIFFLNNLNLFIQVSRKLVVLESDVERSEDKASHSFR